MYFASTKYILHVKQDSLLVEPFVLYQVLIAIIHFKLVRVFITVDFKLCLMRSYKYCCEITFFCYFPDYSIESRGNIENRKKGLRVVQNCKSSLLMVFMAIAQVKEWIRPLWCHNVDRSLSHSRCSDQKGLLLLLCLPDFLNLQPLWVRVSDFVRVSVRQPALVAKCFYPRPTPFSL